MHWGEYAFVHDEVRDQRARRWETRHGDEIAEEFGFTKLWLKLRLIQRAAARLIAESIPQVYGDTDLQRIKALTGEKPPTSSQLQTAIKRLSRLDVIDKTGGNWRIGDPLLAAWIRARPESEF